MVALSGIRRDLHLTKEGIHLGIIEAATRANGSVTGHRRQDMRNPVFKNTASADLREFLGNVADKGAGIRGSQQCRHTPNKDASLAKSLNLQPKTGKQGHIFECRLKLIRRQVDNFGYQQRLNSDPVSRHRSLHPLHDKPFMGGMLVDQGDAVTGLGHNIGSVELRPRRAKKGVIGLFITRSGRG